ncbi:MAG: vanadium-dependent haloperoxidase [Bacteroidota bacterium]
MCVLALLAPAASGQSVARQWNEALLEAIRSDFARPTVHARNLFHVSVAMYDAWAAYDDRASTYLLNRSDAPSSCQPGTIAAPTEPEAVRAEAVSYAAYRLLRHRFINSPGALETIPALDSLLAALGYDASVTAADPASPAGLGNAIAACLIAYGLSDGANEVLGYAYQDYAPANPALRLDEPGNPALADPNRWQPLLFDTFVDQSGNEVPGGEPLFVGPEWGRVRPFALQADDRSPYSRDGADFSVYFDPGPPPLLDTLAWGGATAAYLEGFALVAAWSGHLDPSDGVVWDASPGRTGGLTDDDFPTEYSEYPAFYDPNGAVAIGPGRTVNPVTGEPYASNPVARGDFARVLAEFWADGPDSETPPGHWFTILNTVSDDDRLDKRVGGEGPLLSDLEWDVKTYLALGGAMHDAAVAAWSLKGRYDYIRPVSALRAMAERGQSSDPSSPSYHPGGVPLEPGVAELITADDPLAGANGEHVGEVKVRAWRGPDAIEDPEDDVAGVGWVRLKVWWPYQRPTFVTPPFAGYVSGHSTFSRAAAEVLERLTGSPYFPGGLGEFVAPVDSFLVFEDGPSETVRLQWATYRDAADQSGLSRIWGGIHPPADDLPGRRIGAVIGPQAFELAAALFEGRTSVDTSDPPSPAVLRVYPSPLRAGQTMTVSGMPGAIVSVVDARGRKVLTARTDALGRALVPTETMAAGVYAVRVVGRDQNATRLVSIVRR